MNFLTAGVFLCLSTNLLFAQINVEVKTIDLSSNGKSKTSKIVKSTFNNDSKEAKLTFVKTYCDGDESKGYNERTFTAKEVVYNFEHLSFDKDFGFKNLETEKISGLQNAIVKYPVLGKDFDIKCNYGYVAGNQELGQFEYAVKTYANSRNGIFYCDQKIQTQKGSVKIALPGESLLLSNSTKDGVMVISQNSKAETTVNVRFYDHEGNKKTESSFMINYGFAAKSLVLKNENGGEDVVLVVQPSDKFNKYGVKIDKIKPNPLEFEYIRIDGVSMQVKDRFTFNAVSSQWNVEQVIEKEGAVYLFGQASAKVAYCGYSFGTFNITEGGSFQNSIQVDKLENYQLMKVQNGKMDFISGFTPEEMTKVQSLVSGAKGSNNASGYFRLQEIKIENNKIYITGQNTKPSDYDDRKQEFVMMINETGKLTNLFFVPKSNYANSNMFFTPDGKSMYWAIYDYSEYKINATRLEPVQIKLGFLVGGTDHTFMEARKNDDGPQLQIVKFDLTKNTAGPLEIFGKDEYTLFDDSPVLYSNDTEVVFLGVAGKAKERVSKIIRLKF